MRISHADDRLHLIQHVILEEQGLGPEQPITCSLADTSAGGLSDGLRPLPLLVA